MTIIGIISGMKQIKKITINKKRSEMALRKDRGEVYSK